LVEDKTFVPGLIHIDVEYWHGTIVLLLSRLSVLYTITQAIAIALARWGSAEAEDACTQL
jgi:hypothetical protein